VVEDRQRPRACRDFCVGPQHREVRGTAVKLRERFRIVGAVYNLEAKSRIGVFQNGGQLGGKARVFAVWVADREGKRLRILQQNAADPDGGERQKQREQHIQQHLPAIGPCYLRARARLFGRLWDVSAHGSTPEGCRFATFRWHPVKS